MSTLIKHVYGNVLKLAIPLTQIVKEMIEGEVVTTESDFYPNPNYPTKITLRGEGSIKFDFNATVDGNVATMIDYGTVLVGLYQVEVRCYDMQNNPMRYMVRAIVQVVDATIDAGIQAGIEFDTEEHLLDGAVFFYAKGDKGDPFTWEDFTPEQILLLQKPAQDKADEVSALEVQWSQEEANRELAEQGRVQAEQQRELGEQQRNTQYEQAEQQRTADYVLAEQSRNTRYGNAEDARDTLFAQHEQTRDQSVASAVSNANVAANNANSKAQIAAEKAEEARLAAINAKADYVGQDNYVYHWNASTQLYEKTNILVKGDHGVSVSSVEQIVTSTESGGINVIRVTLNNGNYYDFQVKNGVNVTPTYDAQHKNLILT